MCDAMNWIQLASLFLRVSLCMRFCFCGELPRNTYIYGIASFKEIHSFYSSYNQIHILPISPVQVLFSILHEIFYACTHFAAARQYMIVAFRVFTHVIALLGTYIDSIISPKPLIFLCMCHVSEKHCLSMPTHELMFLSNKLNY